MVVSTRLQTSLENNGASYAITIKLHLLAMSPEDHYINLLAIEINYGHQPSLLNR